MPDLRSLLAEHDLEVKPEAREIDLDLHAEADRARSRVLHRLRVLGVAGFDRTAGTDMIARPDLSRVWERWRVRWTPDHDATTIEAARYGPTLGDCL